VTRVAGLAITMVICHVGYRVTVDVMRRLADGVDPSVITTAEAAAGTAPMRSAGRSPPRWRDGCHK